MCLCTHVHFRPLLFANPGRGLLLSLGCFPAAESAGFTPDELSSGCLNSGMLPFKKSQVFFTCKNLSGVLKRLLVQTFYETVQNSIIIQPYFRVLTCGIQPVSIWVNVSSPISPDNSGRTLHTCTHTEFGHLSD